ncbi:MAG: FtsH protease activity modulator HflK [Rhodobacteraceae bacterium]|nr:FtsH protease activity modulator HflK [Paracoccaceae bacterium]
MAGNSGGPWGGGPGGGDNRGNDNRGGRKPGEGPQLNDIEDIMKKGQERLRVLMGGRGGGPRGPGGGGGSGGPSPRLVALGVIVLAGLVWAYNSFYTVRPEERSVELFLGKFHRIGMPGLNFAPWPLVSAEVIPTSGERTTDVGSGQGGQYDTGLMLTSDQNIVDVHFQVVWNIEDPAKFLFNLADPTDTVRAVSESAMRDIIARTDLAPILNKDRGVIAADLMQAVQGTLDSYTSGIRVIRVNFDSADPPKEVIDSFRAVQAAQQQRDTLVNQAQAYANQKLGAANGEAAQVTQEAEGYRAQVINAAKGDASRFDSIYQSYLQAPDVTRRRMYIETMESVLGGMHKVILDGVGGTAGGAGVVPYLPLDKLLADTKTTPKGAGQ